MAARRFIGLILLLFACTSLTLPWQAQAAPWHDRTRFASSRFEQIWRRADEMVAEGRTDRSWTWGPTAWFDYYEFYKQSPSGLRLVQYFDKARMEINNPGNSAGSLGGVTNGLLPVEMVSGRLKLGDGIGPDQNEQREPADIPVVGDQANENPNAPTYRSFSSVATTDNGYRDPSKIGQRVGTTFTRSGGVGFREDLRRSAVSYCDRHRAPAGARLPPSRGRWAGYKWPSFPITRALTSAKPWPDLRPHQAPVWQRSGAGCVASPRSSQRVEVEQTGIGVTIGEHHDGDLDGAEGIEQVVGADSNLVARRKVLGIQRRPGV